MGDDLVKDLAIRVQHNPGLFAVLLGSGVSSAAGILTGWGITLDLIRQLAAVDGVDSSDVAGEKAAQWYSSQYKKQGKYQDPDYSDVLQDLFPTPEERQGALAPYFEASQQEVERHGPEFKRPTTVHRALAWLIARGYVRFVITTNFDRLLEDALRDLQVSPNVVLPEQAASLQPLYLHDHLIIKVHGDYRQMGIRNTKRELSKYPARLTALLQELFHNHALIICGWSALYDVALRQCLTGAAPTRSVVWVDREELSAQTAETAAAVSAEVHIVSNGADGFFMELRDKVQAVEDVRSKPPGSAEIAAATLKRYLSGPTADPIRAHDLVADEGRRLHAVLTDGDSPLHLQRGDTRNIVEKLADYEEASTILRALFSVGFRWVTPELRPVLLETLTLMTEPGPLEKKYILDRICLYPALLLFYTAGIVCVQTRRGALLGDLLRANLWHEGQLRPAFAALVPWYVVESQHLMMVPEYGRRKTPVSDYLFGVLRQSFKSMFPSERTFTEAFDRFEYLASLVFSEEGPRFRDERSGWCGCFAWRGRNQDATPVATGIEDQAEKAGNAWWFLESGFFRSNIGLFLAAKREFDLWVSGTPLH